MRSCLGVLLVSALALLGSPQHALSEAERGTSELEVFSRRLETVLNADVASGFNAIAISELEPALVQRYQRFQQDFPAVTWRVEPDAPLADGRQGKNARARAQRSN